MPRLIANLVGLAMAGVPALVWLVKFIGLAGIPQDLSTWSIVLATMFEETWLVIPVITGLVVIGVANVPAIRLWERFGLIPMKDAVQIARDKSVGDYHSRMAEGFAQDDNFEGVLSYFAHAIALGDNVRLYGKRVASTVYEPIPREEIPRCGFGDYGASMLRHGERVPLFNDVAVKRVDLYRRLRELKKEGGSNGTR